VRFLTRGLEIEADPDAGPRFRTAAVRLGEVELDTVARRPVAADAARLLVGLALGSAGDELGELLMPDPAMSDNRWTVSCYEIGGLTPVAVRDFDDPVEAVVTVSACPDEAHVAAELVASNDNGLRWTALWRTDDHISFQLPTVETADAGEETEEGDESEELAGALERWRVRLDEWSGRDTEDASAARQPTAQVHALEERLNRIEATLGDIRSELQGFALDTELRDGASADAIEHAIDVRFQALSKVVHAALDRLGAQIVGEMRQPSAADDERTSNVIDLRGSNR